MNKPKPYLKTILIFSIVGNIAMTLGLLRLDRATETINKQLNEALSENSRLLGDCGVGVSEVKDELKELKDILNKKQVVKVVVKQSPILRVVKQSPILRLRVVIKRQ